MKKTLSATATDLIDQGLLQVNVVSIQNNFPIQNATVRISYKGNPDSTVEEVSTNSSGQTEQVSLDAPPLEYSMSPSDEQPYSEYNLHISAPGFKPLVVSGTEILPEATAIQPVALEPETDTQEEENPVVIPDHTLYGNYPPKIAEAEIKPVNETGEIVLSRVLLFHKRLWYMMEFPQIPLHPIIMFLIEIILKMWLPAKFMPPGRSLRSPPTFWRSCHLP